MSLMQFEVLMALLGIPGVPVCRALADCARAHSPSCFSQLERERSTSMEQSSMFARDEG